jgi:hypothetical protein
MMGQRPGTHTGTQAILNMDRGHKWGDASTGAGGNALSGTREAGLGWQANTVSGAPVIRGEEGRPRGRKVLLPPLLQTLVQASITDLPIERHFLPPVARTDDAGAEDDDKCGAPRHGVLPKVWSPDLDQAATVDPSTYTAEESADGWALYKCTAGRWVSGLAGFAPYNVVYLDMYTGLGTSVHFGDQVSLPPSLPPCLRPFFSVPPSLPSLPPPPPLP